MRRILFICTLALLTSIGLAAQTPPAAPPAKPAAPPRATAAAAAKFATITIQVTDALGAPLPETMVTTTTGVVSREGVTTEDGSLRMLNMRPGTYRLRFVREGSMTLERELTLRSGEALTIDVSLSAAPPPPKAPEPVVPPSASTTLGPPGDPKVTPVPLFLERNFIGGREGRKESVLGCTATGTATLHQLRESWLAHTHDQAEEWIYVVAGEGTLRLGSTEQKIQAGTFSLVPHTMSHALIPQGRNPLIVISVLSGPACKP
jgi:mannose-6-phosphate isomerase-like protein (cupin superfamily)